MNYLDTPTPDSFRAVEEGIERVSRKVASCSRDDIILLRLVTYLARNYEEMISRIIRPLRLNEVMFKTLLMAFGSPANEVNPSRLSTVTGESRANMTRICDELSQRGLIKRHASDSDRRRVVVSLTSAGERLVRNVLPRIGEKQRQVNAALSSGEKQQLERLLKKQFGGLEAVLGHKER